MNTAVIKRGFHGAISVISGRAAGKIALLLVFAAVFAHPAAREVTQTALSEAYYQVSVFVAATLFGIFMFERALRRDMPAMLRRYAGAQVLFAAVCGAIPGCGGAIFVVTQYIRGAMSFGGVVATLTATMGDAAFLLLARAPAEALLVFATCFVAGTVFGYLVDWTHGRDFLRHRGNPVEDDEKISESPLLSRFYGPWLALFLPGALIGLGYAFQADMDAMLSIAGVEWVSAFGAAAAAAAVLMWALNPLSDIRLCTSPRRALTRRVADTTNFITVWVLCGFVAYGLAADVFGFDLAALFNSWLWMTPLVAALIGFIPGCGPQVVVTTLYLNGAIPLSAQIANAISNDGDALFPAVAIAPKASIIATLYTAFPALLLGYGWFFLIE